VTAVQNNKKKSERIGKIEWFIFDYFLSNVNFVKEIRAR